jgi:hypothetical protein
MIFGVEVGLHREMVLGLKKDRWLGFWWSCVKVKRLKKNIKIQRRLRPF